MTLDAIVDNLQVPSDAAAGAPFPISLRVRNVGSDAFVPGLHRLGSMPQDNFYWGTNRLELPQPVPPGSSCVVLAALTPQQGGVFPCSWRMLQERWGWFGAASPPVQVQVADAPFVWPPPRADADDLCAKQVLNTGPFRADGVTRSRAVENTSGRTLRLAGVQLWLGVDMGGRCDAAISAARRSDGSQLAFMPVDHYADSSQGAANATVWLPGHALLEAGDALVFAYFANGFGGAFNAHFQGVLYFRG